MKTKCFPITWGSHNLLNNYLLKLIHQLPINQILEYIDSKFDSIDFSLIGFRYNPDNADNVAHRCRILLRLNCLSLIMSNPHNTEVANACCTALISSSLSH